MKITTNFEDFDLFNSSLVADLQTLKLWQALSFEVHISILKTNLVSDFPCLSFFSFHFEDVNLSIDQAFNSFKTSMVSGNFTIQKQEF